MPDPPSLPLTFTERMVCDCVARGWGYVRIAAECHCSVRTARVHVHNIAAKLPMDEDVKPYQRVFLWLQHRQWLIRRANEAA